MKTPVGPEKTVLREFSICMQIDADGETFLKMLVLLYLYLSKTTASQSE